MSKTRRGRIYILLVFMVSCAAPIKDICATGLNTWIDTGYGNTAGSSSTTGIIGETNDNSHGYDIRLGFNIYWDLTGSCWEYEQTNDIRGISQTNTGTSVRSVAPTDSK